MHKTLMLVILLLAGCSQSAAKPDSSRQAGAASPPFRGVDSMCMQDCLGNNGTKDFCDDRCTY